MRDPLAMRGLVSAGLAVTIVPQLGSDVLDGIVLRPIEGQAPQRDVYAIMPAGGRHPSPRRWWRRSPPCSAAHERPPADHLPRPPRHRRRRRRLPGRAPARTSSAPTSTRPTPRAASSSCGWSSRSPAGDLDALGRAFGDEVGERLDMDWRLTDADAPEADGAARLARGSLPRRPAVAPPARRAGGRHRVRGVQPSGPPVRCGGASASHITTSPIPTSRSCWRCCTRPTSTSSCSRVTCASSAGSSCPS